ncbi:Pyruvate phosphate dikinase, PEP/pyruvate binding domain [Desulfacinum hydrothermale DSM 13146]|uniref:Pyruvate phosphate dikinase, PEP/pyruvate binding domain n=1 Tax=Desulfacinum hydrothermale DSM 13146 TaxID=1121390 RepID=A0A1W1XP15_9BACT|nr:PEP/pyruvate-binding domain-containing protein [Desulfacinum hydrothermale]SMC25617.1 Pyruvate phosphate dikinase, PEP/pyruvate binding domain [Desulfacinum hydrothermale DSM 13146]
MSQKLLTVAFEKADPAQVDKLGAKGAKLVEDFQNLRSDFPGKHHLISVPDGFLLTTDAWRLYRQNGDRLPQDLWAQVTMELSELEGRVGRRFGDVSGSMPLIVAVRGGAPVSLPGAISTILNVGLNDETITSLVEAGEDEAFLLSTYLEAIRMYGEVVLNIPYAHFFQILQRFHVGDEGSVPAHELLALIDAYKKVLLQVEHPRRGTGYESDPMRQLRLAIESVFDSWMGETAVEARVSRQPKVSDHMGTAVIVQAMVFGNRDSKNCLGGVLFTRNPRTGSPHPVIEWAPKVQCDKIVSGKLRKQLLRSSDLQQRFPDIYDLLLTVRDRFETRAKRPLDIEFTVEARKLYVLQRRPLRMTFAATARAMWDLVDEGKTNIQLASLIINNALEQPEKALKEGFTDYQVLAAGEPITDTADWGRLVFGTEEALEWARRGEPVIMLRKRPYGETDLAVNHPNVRGIIRCDGNVTGHEAVSAVAYSKPYLINVVDVEGRPLVFIDEDQIQLNPECSLAPYMGRRVFVDGDRGIVGISEAEDFLEDRKARKKLYVDWEYLRDQFQRAGYGELDYETLLDIHYQMELELAHYQRLESRLKAGDKSVSEKELMHAFGTYLLYIPERDRARTLALKDVALDEFDLGPPLVYHGSQLGREVLKILRALMLCTTWRTHWIHEIMVEKARERGESENDVIRDIFIKNRTMSVLKDFEAEGFHLMRVPHYYYLIFASNFEYDQDLDRIEIGPGFLQYSEKEVLARNFLSYLEQVNLRVRDRVRIVQGEPPLGRGHARIVSIGLAIPEEEFQLVCRYLRTFLDQSKHGCPLNLQSAIPEGDFVDLYHLDPAFAPFPEMRIMKVARGQEGDPADRSEKYVIALGRCSYGEFDGVVYGRDDYEALMDRVKDLEAFAVSRGLDGALRPWQFEVDPYRRHSVIAAVGVQVDGARLAELLSCLKDYLGLGAGSGPASDSCPPPWAPARKDRR